MTWADTHCHIHSQDYELDATAVLERASTEGVATLLCVGTDANDSARAVDFVTERKNCYASVGLHPHDARYHEKQMKCIEILAKNPQVVAIGECGLDYYYEHSSREQQKASLIAHLNLAQSLKLPLIFHVRAAFEDFWSVIDNFTGIRGVIHSFSATTEQLNQALERGFYIGLNGIMTFTKDEAQLAAAKAIPLEKLVLETDSPYLTPTPFRGKINEPQYVVKVGEFLAELRSESLEVLAETTTKNVKELFGL